VTLADLKEQSKLDWKEDPDVPVAARTPSTHPTSLIAILQNRWHAFLTDELKLRGLSVTGNLRASAERLQVVSRKEAACLVQIEELEHGRPTQ
jgi:hypothetical protein